MTAASRIALLTLAILAGYSARAQQTILPDAPSQNFVAPGATTPKIVPFTMEKPHRFLDRQNKIAFASLAGLVAIDAVTTQRLVSSGAAIEANPVWQPLVHGSWQGEAAASALGFGAALGVSYSLHKMGHHKIERWANWLIIGVEAVNDAHNLMLDAQR